MRSQDTLTVDSLISQAQQLHSPPEVACSLLRLTRNEDFDIQEVVECIERDPALTARILKIVNSSRYGLRERVTSVSRAFAYLGCRTVRVLALTFSIVDTFTRGLGKRFYSVFWLRALTTATVTTRLAKRLETFDARDAYTCGLLADIGVLLLAQVQGKEYTTLYQDNPLCDDLAAAELATLGFDHSAIGARLLTQWGFPSTLSAVVADHHACQNSDLPLAAAVRAGELTTDLLWAPHHDRGLQASRWFAEQFQMDIDAFTELVLACQDEIALEAEMYGVQLEHALDSQSLIAEAQRRLFDTALNATQDLCSLEAVMQGNHHSVPSQASRSCP